MQFTAINLNGSLSKNAFFLVPIKLDSGMFSYQKQKVYIERIEKNIKQAMKNKHTSNKRRFL